MQRRIGTKLRQIKSIEEYLESRKAVTRTLENNLAEARQDILLLLEDLNIKTYEHPQAQVQVRNRTTRSVESKDVGHALNQLEDRARSHELYDAIFPPTFDKKAALEVVDKGELDVPVAAKVTTSIAIKYKD